ncbi:UNVERIFIED_CONTAM: hypothetical protein HDU68_004968 [Siphonaria sp. JEL0065]|nr:hypothetical protein HDU68_004968 [Siphonaria sp. JEL0065]
MIQIISSPDPSSPNIGAILGIVICILAAVLVVIIGVLWANRNGRKEKAKRDVNHRDREQYAQELVSSNQISLYSGRMHRGHGGGRRGDGRDAAVQQQASAEFLVASVLAGGSISENRQ